MISQLADFYSFRYNVLLLYTIKNVAKVKHNKLYTFRTTSSAKK